MIVVLRIFVDLFGFDLLIWKYFGDLCIGMMGVWIGVI